MALPQQGTETDNSVCVCVIHRAVLMALPQQGTETKDGNSSRSFFSSSVNGLTPTGDGNLCTATVMIELFAGVNGLTPTGDGNSSTNLFITLSANLVLMALPQQGTETISRFVSLASLLTCVNGLTPTGDGNHRMPVYEEYWPECERSVNGLTPTGDGNSKLLPHQCNTV